MTKNKKPETEQPGTLLWPADADHISMVDKHGRKAPRGFNPLEKAYITHELKGEPSDYSESEGKMRKYGSGSQLEDLRDELNNILRKTLNHREREIIKLRYGLSDGYVYTLEEVGHIYKVTPERIRQIEKEALQKLQDNNSLEAFKDFTAESEATERRVRDISHAYLYSINKPEPDQTEKSR